MDYSYEELKSDLATGHEVEFYYNGHKYSISNNKFGWYLTKYYDENYQSFKTVNELLERGKINRKTLEEIWDEVDVETIF